MKKYAVLFAVNALIFGALSGNAWMTIAASDNVSPVTWAMAVAPLVVLAGIALWLMPRALAAMKSGQEQRAEAKQERADAHVAQAVVDDSAASRLRRFSQPANAPTVFDDAGDAGEFAGDAEAAALAAPEIEHGVDIETEPEPEFEPEAEFEPEPEFEPAAEFEPEPEPAADFTQTAASQWDWLMSEDAVRQLRPADDTGFPWVAATIAEVASAVINIIPESCGNDYIAEAEAWLTIAAELLPTTAIAGDDAQSFVGWVNDMAVHAHMTHKDVTLDALLDEALANLCERADDDDALALALPAAVYSHDDIEETWAKAS
ncbi:MAG: hypothetical protein ABL909_03190 [Sphingopyxis sp.]